MILNNRIDFAVVFSVKNANPNGDPVGDNRPRTTSDGFGEVSDVCLKRKIRNRLQANKNPIFVQSDYFCDDGEKSLSDRFNNYIGKDKDKESIAKKVCEKWLDVRAFGQVFAFKGKKEKEIDEVSLGIRGPVTIQSAFSIEPIEVESIQITKSVNSETTDKGGKSPDTMGMKHRVNAVYVTYGSISPQLAEKTGFTKEDANQIKEALKTLFVGDESAARPSGSMKIIKVIWWEHNNKLGQYSSAKVHDSLTVDASGEVSLNELDGLKPEIFEG